MTDPRPVLVVANDGGFDELMQRVVRAGEHGATVELLAPAESGLLLSVREFQHLRQVIDRRRLHLRFYTDDPMRARLASMHGIDPFRVPERLRIVAGTGPVAPAAGNKPASATASPTVAPTGTAPNGAISGAGPAVAAEGGGPTAAGGATGATGGKPVSAKTAAKRANAAWPAAPVPVVIPEPPSQPTAPENPRGKGRFAGRKNGERDETGPETPTGAAANPANEAISIAPAAARRRTLPRWLSLLLAVVAVGALAYAGWQIARPEAVVTIGVQHTPVTGAIPVDAAIDGKPASGVGALTIAARPIEIPVTAESSTAATGEQRIPTGTATGPVQFANPTADAVTVPAGTVLTNGAGDKFTLNAAVEVPGVDPATGRSGRATGEVTAAVQGEAGNTDPGEIGGQLPGGVYYSNREQGTSGGEDRAVAVVADADLAKLKGNADASIASTALTEAAKKAPAGAVVIPQSVEITKRDDVASAKAGEQADTVSMKTTATARVLVFDPADILTAARAADPAAWQALAPAGSTVEPASIALGQVTIVSQSTTGAQLQAAITGEAVARFNAQQEATLAEQMRGRSPAEAEALLKAEPGVDSVSIALKPGWFARDLPSDPTRIHFEFAP